MVSNLQDIDITGVFNHFAQKKCSIHKNRIVSSVCLHDDCWKSEYDQAFFCVDCIINHTLEVHRNSIGSNTLFTNELFDELNEYENNLRNSDKLEEKIRKFEQRSNELYAEVEKWTKCQFSELKKFIESHLKEKIPAQINHYSEVIKKVKQMLYQAKLDISKNYQNREHMKSYFTQIKKIQNDLTDAINEKAQNDGELDIKLQHMVSEIKNNVKNQVNRFMKGFISE